jgi:hypothetical protein
MTHWDLANFSEVAPGLTHRDTATVASGITVQIAGMLIRWTTHTGPPRGRAAGALDHQAA